MADTTSAAQSERELFEAHMRTLNPCVRLARQREVLGGYYRTLTVQRAWELWQAARRTQPGAPAAVEPPELSPDFTDSARAALLWVLWHHQGGSSPVGQPIRFALGMGQHDRMNDHQLAEAKRWEKLHPVNPSAWARKQDPLTDDAIVAAFCETPGLRPQQMVSCFVAGARFAETHHGIT